MQLKTAMSFLGALTLSSLLLLDKSFPFSKIILYCLIVIATCVAIHMLCNKLNSLLLKKLAIVALIAIATYTLASQCLQHVVQLFQKPWFAFYNKGLLITTVYLFFTLWVKIKKEVEQQSHSRYLLISPCALQDPRLINLAKFGLLDEKIAIPSFLQKHYSDSIAALQQLPQLNLKIVSVTTPSDADDVKATIALAMKNHAGVVVANYRYEPESMEGLRVISLQALHNALKPQMPLGELLNVKIQRLGKELDQGVGYLEDGTMVVVNGGGQHIGKMVDSHVLSVHQTASGRLVFCNLV